MAQKKLGFGLMRLPVLDDGQTDLEQVKRMADLFLENGFTYFDTSFVYHNGQSEHALRQAVVERYPHDRFTIATKFPTFSVQTEDQVEGIFAQQLENLGTEYIDYYLLHSPSYMTCIEEAKAELNSNARPELKRYLDSLDGYDNVFVCGPCWWGTYPMAVFTQLEKLDWTGKKVMALMTHEGSGLAGSERDLKKTCKGASFGKSLAVAGHSAAGSEAQVAAWAKSQV